MDRIRAITIFGIVTLLGLTTLVGCATVEQARQDAQIGATTPLEQGEVSPQDQAREVTNILSAVPVVGPFAPILAPILGTVFLWSRGRRIRKGKPTSSNPITGYFGSKVGLESFVQNISNVFTGAFELGPDGSMLKRGWKAGLATLGGIIATALTVPDVQALVVAHPEYAAALTVISGFIAGVEKETSKVLPLSSPAITPNP